MCPECGSETKIVDAGTKFESIRCIKTSIILCGYCESRHSGNYFIGKHICDECKSQLFPNQK